MLLSCPGGSSDQEGVFPCRGLGPHAVRSREPARPDAWRQHVCSASCMAVNETAPGCVAPGHRGARLSNTPRSWACLLRPAAFPFFYIEPSKKEFLPIVQKFVGPISRVEAEEIAPIGEWQARRQAARAPLSGALGGAVRGSACRHRAWGRVCRGAAQGRPPPALSDAPAGPALPPSPPPGPGAIRRERTDLHVGGGHEERHAHMVQHLHRRAQRRGGQQGAGLGPCAPVRV